jgi:hypothetical protein
LVAPSATAPASEPTVRDPEPPARPQPKLAPTWSAALTATYVLRPSFQYNLVSIAAASPDAASLRWKNLGSAVRPMARAGVEGSYALLPALDLLVAADVGALAKLVGESDLVAGDSRYFTKTTTHGLAGRLEVFARKHWRTVYAAAGLASEISSLQLDATRIDQATGAEDALATADSHVTTLALAARLGYAYRSGPLLVGLAADAGLPLADASSRLRSGGKGAYSASKVDSDGLARALGHRRAKSAAALVLSVGFAR